MRSATVPIKAMPFFLPGSRGDLFAVYYPPQRTPARGALLYVHAFAEEANCSRPVIAAVARAIARLGYGVLTVDLYGCGDSAGEFRDALWSDWHEDLAIGVEWLQDRGLTPVGLWGLRLGGLLALDVARLSQRTFPFIVLWHPPLSGAETLRQFLRLSYVQEVGDLSACMTTHEMRRRLTSETCIEVIGWELNNDLASALERLKLSSLLSQVSSAIYCVEFAQRTKLPTPRQRTLQAYKDKGFIFDFRQSPVRSFWADRAGMTDDCQVLIDLMNSVLMR